jgi:hypothetical protein
MFDDLGGLRVFSWIRFPRLRRARAPSVRKPWEGAREPSRG